MDHVWLFLDKWSNMQCNIQTACACEHLHTIEFCKQFNEFSKIFAYKDSGIQLGTYKSINESVTRVAVYVSLLALYCLGGNKVKAGELSVGTVVSFIGYTFTLTFAVQGLVYSFGDLRGAFDVYPFNYFGFWVSYYGTRI